MQFTFEVKDTRSGEITRDKAHSNSEKELVELYKVMGKQIVNILDRTDVNLAEREREDKLLQQSIPEALKRQIEEQAKTDLGFNKEVDLSQTSQNVGKAITEVRTVQIQNALLPSENNVKEFTILLSTLEKVKTELEEYKKKEEKVEKILYKEYTDNNSKYRLNLCTNTLEKYSLVEMTEEEKKNIFFIKLKTKTPQNFADDVKLFTYKWIVL